jgi:hypothetical protein
VLFPHARQVLRITRRRRALGAIEHSKLCSQRLYQFNLVLDGTSRESASVWLRTVDGRTECRMTRAWAGEVANHEGLASAEDFFGPWEQHVGEVAARRRAMNKPIL